MRERMTAVQISDLEVLEPDACVSADPHMLAPATGAADAAPAAEGAPAGHMGPRRAHIRAHAAADALHRLPGAQSEAMLPDSAPGQLA